MSKIDKRVSKIERIRRLAEHSTKLNFRNAHQKIKERLNEVQSFLMCSEKSKLDFKLTESSNIQTKE
jgi:hypothetical protein